MEENIIIVIVASLANILVALIGFVGIASARKQSSSTEKKLDEFTIAHIRQHSSDSVRLRLLWRIYVEDALESAHKAGIIERNSPLKVSARMNEMLPAKLHREIERRIRACAESAPHAIDPNLYEISAEVLGGVFGEIEDVVRMNPVTFEQVTGAVYVKVERMLELDA